VKLNKMAVTMTLCMTAALAGCGESPEQAAQAAAQAKAKAEAIEAEKAAAALAEKKRQEQAKEAEQAKLDIEAHKKHMQVPREEYKPLDPSRLIFLYEGFANDDDALTDEDKFRRLVSALALEQDGEDEISMLAADYLSSRSTFEKRDIQEKLVPIIKNKLKNVVKDRYVVLEAYPKLKSYDFDTKGFVVETFDKESSKWSFSDDGRAQNSKQEIIKFPFKTQTITLGNNEKFKFLPVSERDLAEKIEEMRSISAKTQLLMNIYLHIEGMRDSDRYHTKQFIANIVKVEFLPYTLNNYTTNSTKGDILVEYAGN